MMTMMMLGNKSTYICMCHLKLDFSASVQTRRKAANLVQGRGRPAGTRCSSLHPPEHPPLRNQMMIFFIGWETLFTFGFVHNSIQVIVCKCFQQVGQHLFLHWTRPNRLVQYLPMLVIRRHCGNHSGRICNKSKSNSPKRLKQLNQKIDWNIWHSSESGVIGLGIGWVCESTIGTCSNSPADLHPNALSLSMH